MKLEPIHHWMKAHLPANPAILEIGGSDGTDTARFFHLFQRPRVIVLEPLPANLAVLRARKLPAVIVPTAAGRRDGTAQFYPASNNASGGLRKPQEHLKRWPWVRFGPPIHVPVQTLATLFGPTPPHFDFIWMDAQGSEGDIIRGGRAVFANARYLFTEAYTNEIFAGQTTRQGLRKLLPEFELVRVFAHDNILLRNRRFKSAACPCRSPEPHTTCGPAPG